MLGYSLYEKSLDAVDSRNVGESLYVGESLDVGRFVMWRRVVMSGESLKVESGIRHVV
jgi:hypothetical protein